MVSFLATPLSADNTPACYSPRSRLLEDGSEPHPLCCSWCGRSSDCSAPTTTCYPPWESRTRAALVRTYRLSYWLTKPRVSRKNKHEQRLQCMGQSAGSFSIWPWWSYSHGRLSFPCAIIYHNFESQGVKKPTIFLLVTFIRLVSFRVLFFIFFPPLALLPLPPPGNNPVSSIVFPKERWN